MGVHVLILLFAEVQQGRLFGASAYTVLEQRWCTNLLTAAVLIARPRLGPVNRLVHQCQMVMVEPVSLS